MTQSRGGSCSPAIAALVSIAVAGGCGDAHVQLSRMFVGRQDGIAVRYPADWRLTTRNPTAVPNPALCFELASGSSAASSVDVKVVEYLPPELAPADRAFYKPRPRHFALAMLRASDNDWTTGKTLSFRARGRVFLVGAVLADPIPDGARRTIEAILDSLRIEPNHRCAPTGGVGSSR